MMDLLMDEVETPVGVVYVVSDGEALCAVDYQGCESRMHTLLARRYPEYALRPSRDPQGFSGRIRAYVAGDFAAVQHLPVSTGGTPFQRHVWTALRKIPHGVTRSYGEIARAIGAPTAVRAVGAANGQNPVAIVIPCHRVIGSNASLTGYAGGMERKRWLLAHEGVAIL